MRSNTFLVSSIIFSLSRKPFFFLNSLPINKFSYIAKSLIKLSSWWINAIPLSSDSFGEEKTTSSPSMIIFPESHKITPPSIFINVLFPAPFSPNKALISPPCNEKSTLSRTRLEPNDLEISFISNFILYLKIRAAA